LLALTLPDYLFANHRKLVNTDRLEHGHGIGS
jgi:hypothetical protein